MLIDWFTVVAQIVNFLILVGLLKHFLWGRLTKAIDDREARVASELARAEENNREAKRQSEIVQARGLELERKRDELLVQARKEVEAERGELLQDARESVSQIEKDWREDLDRERTAFFRELRERAGKEILSVVRRALLDLSSVELQDAVLHVFLEKLRSIDAATLREMQGKEKLICSSADLPEDTRGRILAILQERLGTETELQFEKDSRMGWGIELRGNGRRIGWNPGAYLDVMETNLREALEQREEGVHREAVR